MGLSVGADGSVYIGDTSNNRVRKLSPDGTISTLAGNGTQGFSGDGGAAIAAQLRLPVQVAAASDGSVLIADYLNQRVRKISPDGIITTVAGTGATGFNPDGPVASVNLRNPWGVAVLPNGDPLIADTYHHLIRTVTNGNVISVGGNGVAGYTGDGQATSQRLRHPMGLSTAADGSIYFADYSNQRVRKIDPNGNLVTLAGDGASGYTGDGGPATSARLRNPRDVVADRAGNLYIADQSNHAIRKITPDGTIGTIAGGIGAGGTGDGNPASTAKLNNPWSLAIASDGSLYVGTSDDRVRKITNELPAVVLSASDTAGVAPLPIAFTGTASSDPDGTVISYGWDFGDGTTSDESSPTHTYARPGSYAVTLTVMDDSGAEVTASNAVNVSEATTPVPARVPATPSASAVTCMGQIPSIVGTNGHDVIVGTDGADVILTGKGDDRVRGLGGNDRICLGSGSDRARGGPGNDVIRGGTGPDVLIGGAGADGLAGDKGKDVLRGHGGADTLAGGGQADIITGGTGRDVLRGGGGNDRLYGGRGADRLFGGSSNDRLFGGWSDDRLVGNSGRDIGHGGRGRDTCSVNRAAGC
ncbi:MAG: PKD domain-containing protein [Thermoleophilia bacterium]|nr:PKD domain-containing protein [Thermoleophilia bacterium]